MAKEGIVSGQDSVLNTLSAREKNNIQPQVVIEAAINGDQYAINILSDIGKNLGKSIAILIQLFNPELIIMGGKIAEAKQYITIPILHSLNTYCIPQIREKATIVVSELGQNAGMLGSFVTVMDTIFETHIELKW